MKADELAEIEAGELDHDGTYDKDGWQYAPEFGARFSGTPKMTDFVRRRKWVRTCFKIEKVGSPDTSAKKNLKVPTAKPVEKVITPRLDDRTENVE